MRKSPSKYPPASKEIALKPIDADVPTFAVTLGFIKILPLLTPT